MANNLVALMAQGPTIDSPFDVETKRLNLQQLQNGAVMDDFKISQARQAQADDDATRQVFAQHTDPAKRLQALAAISPTAYMKVAKSEADVAKSTADAQKAGVERATAIRGIMGSAAQELAANPTYENAVAINARLRQQLPPDIASGIDDTKLPRDPVALKKMADQVILGAVAPKDKMHDDTLRRNNDQTTEVSAENNRRTAAAAIEARQAARDAKASGDLEKKVTAFSNQLDKTNLPQFENLLGNIEALIAKAKGADGKGDIPGYGATGSLPQFMLSDAGKELRQQIAQLRNLTLKDRSGAAVTNQELTRFLEELGTGNFKNDEDLGRGIENVRSNLDAVKRNVVAGVDDATLNEYSTRGGIQFKRGDQKKAPAGDKGGKTVTRTGMLNGRKVVQYSDGSVDYAPQ
jgi:hypothetical protein